MTTFDPQSLSPEQLAQQLRLPLGHQGQSIAEAMNHSNHAINQSCIAKIKLPPEAEAPRLLEIGPGNAGFLDRILETHPHLQYTGLDWSQDMVDLAGQQHASKIATNQAQFLQGEAHRLPFSRNSFDGVLTVNTLYFWPDLNKTLQAIFSVLKPGGQLVLGFGDKTFMAQMSFTDHGFLLYSPETVIQALEACGFTGLEHNEHHGTGKSNTGKTVKKHFHCITAKAAKRPEGNMV